MVSKLASQEDHHQDHFHSGLNYKFDDGIDIYHHNTGLMELVSLGVSSIVMVILSKSRLHLRQNWCSCSYNEHNLDLSKINEEKESDEEYDVPLDSFQT